MQQIQRDFPLQALNTFGLPALADRYVVVDSVAGLQALVRAGALAGTAQLVLGGGSNVIFGGDFNGLVLKVAIKGRRLVREDDEAWYVEAGAGETWHDFVRWTLQQGWPGLENLSLIPGTVGAAPIQNIGAYGLEMCARFESLEAVDLGSGESRHMDAPACRFGYRDSVFKGEAAGRYLITSVVFRLPKSWQPITGYADVARELEAQGIAQPDALQVSDAVIAIRSRKLPDPAVLGNAGSFFKNPVVDMPTFARLEAAHPGLPHYAQPDGRQKLAAGWLIEQAGWKGRDLGPVGAFEKQALVLVNRGGARGEDVRRIAEAIRADVRARFGVELEAEPVFV
ncbi:MAG: UDP-N-acetylmuramate dehydrogenase [Rhodocyclaceae bacterium]